MVDCLTLLVIIYNLWVHHQWHFECSSFLAVLQKIQLSYNELKLTPFSCFTRSSKNRFNLMNQQKKFCSIILKVVLSLNAFMFIKGSMV